MDGLGDGRSANPEEARKLLGRLNFRFASGGATRELLHNLEVMRNGLFRWRRPFAIPTSFLIDAQGWLAAIYTGPVKVEELLADVASIDAAPQELLRQAVPFEGSWVRPPSRLTTDQWTEKRAVDHYDSAVELTDAGRLEDAIAQYRQALAINSELADAHGNLGAIFAGLGRQRKAIGQYREALRIDPDHNQANNNLGVALLDQPGRLDEAIEHLKRAIAADPQQATAHESLGMALDRKGEIAQAEKHFREAVRLNPDNPGAHLNLGVALFKQGKVKEALVHYRKVLEANPDSVDAHLRVADIVGHQGRIEDAIGHCRQALRINPDHPPALNLLALMLLSRGSGKPEDVEEAVRLADRANELTNHQQVSMLYTLTLAYAAASRFQEAAATARRVLPLAEAAGLTQLVTDVKQRLELYQTKIRSLD